MRIKIKKNKNYGTNWSEEKKQDLLFVISILYSRAVRTYATFLF